MWESASQFMGSTLLYLEFAFQIQNEYVQKSLCLRSWITSARRIWIYGVGARKCGVWDMYRSLRGIPRCDRKTPKSPRWPSKSTESIKFIRSCAEDLKSCTHGSSNYRRYKWSTNTYAVRYSCISNCSWCSIICNTLSRWETQFVDDSFLSFATEWSCC